MPGPGCSSRRSQGRVEMDKMLSSRLHVKSRSVHQSGLTITRLLSISDFETTMTLGSGSIRHQFAISCQHRAAQNGPKAVTLGNTPQEERSRQVLSSLRLKALSKSGKFINGWLIETPECASPLFKPVTMTVTSRAAKPEIATTEKTYKNDLEICEV